MFHLTIDIKINDIILIFNKIIIDG